MTAETPTYFFMHVMKTGGTTFAQHINVNFPPDAVYPSPAAPDDERRRGYYMIDELRRLSPEQRRSIRVYIGHFPYVVRHLVAADITLTIVRDPVERTISYLRHRRRYHPEMAGKSLEAIYDDGWVFPLYIRDYQAKLFAMTADDKLESHLDVIEVDDRRLEIALENLERVEVLGVQDRYPDFLEAVRGMLGWNIGDVPDLRVSTDGWEIPGHLRERIAADNAADMVLYARAQEIVASRQGS